jgi:hypothetical protein
MFSKQLRKKYTPHTTKPSHLHLTRITVVGLQQVRLGFFLFVKIVKTRASPLGIPRDIYRDRTKFRVKSQLLRCCGPLWSCRCSGVGVELDFLPLTLEASGGCCWGSLRSWRWVMWCFRIRCEGSLCSTAGRLRWNSLHSVIRWLAVCSARLGQLQVGEDVFFILWIYDRNLPWFVRNCVRVRKEMAVICR